MTDSLIANEGDALDDRLLELFLHPGSGGRLAGRVIDGCHLIDVGDVENFLALPPHRKVLLLILLLCLKDRATELRFEPRDADLGASGVRVSYVVNGEIYELVPPPLEIASDIIQQIKELASLPARRGRMPGIWGAVADRIASRPPGPAYGGFRIGAGDRVSEVTVVVRPSPRGDWILMQISAVDPAVPRIAEGNLQGLFANLRGAARGESAEREIAG